MRPADLRHLRAAPRSHRGHRGTQVRLRCCTSRLTTFPRRLSSGFQRHSKPSKLASDGPSPLTAYRGPSVGSLIRRSASLSPEPKNIAKVALGLAPNRATRTSQLDASSSATGTMLARIVMPSASFAITRIPRRATRTRSRCDAGVSTVAPSPPNTNGRSNSGSALRSATIEATPAALTSLYRPASMALVEPSTSVTTTSQSSGTRLYRAGSYTSENRSKTGSAA